MTPFVIELVGLSWRRLGRCAGNPAAYDDAVDAERRTAAKARQAFIDTYCAGCPVSAQCGQWGAETRSTGIFGGEELEFGRTAAQHRAARHPRSARTAPTRRSKPRRRPTVVLTALRGVGNNGPS